MRTTLASQAAGERKKGDYEKVIAALRAVYRADPAYGRTPAALAAVGELYEEMGRQFSDDGYYHLSLGAYQFVIQQYSDTSLARHSLLAIGDIYRSDLDDLENAQAAYRQFLDQYPKTEKAAEAREKLKQIRQLQAARKAARQKAAPSAQKEPAEAEGESADRTPAVTSIRRWVGPNYTRIVISVDGEVKFEPRRLVNPDRLVFDLTNARPSPALMGKTFPVEDGFLRQIRVAQFRPNVTRVVLDIERIQDYSVFSLPNPFRLVIDVHGPASEVAEKGAASKSPGAQRPAVSETSQTASRGNAPLVPARPASTTGEATRKEPGQGDQLGGLGSRESAAGRSETASVAPAVRTPINPAAPTESGSRTLTRALGLKIGRIVIDPGHGGHDTGTVGPTGLTEKEVVLDVAVRLAKLVEDKTGSEVVLTRREDTFIPLEERTAIANEKGADLFISIHANASRDQEARGIETYYLNFTSNSEALEVAARENATSQESVHELRDLIKKIALTEKVEESHEFAKQVQREVHGRLQRAGVRQQDRGVKKAPFVVLIGANMPSILAEVSFLTNPRDERLLKKPDYRQKIADALYQGIAHYVKNLGGVRVAVETRVPLRSHSEDLPVETSARGAAPPN